MSPTPDWWRSLIITSHQENVHLITVRHTSRLHSGNRKWSFRAAVNGKLIFSLEQKRNQAACKCITPPFPLTKSRLNAYNCTYTLKHTLRANCIRMHVCVHTTILLRQLDLISWCGVCSRSAHERQGAWSVTAAWALHAHQFTQQWSTNVGLH